MSDELEKLRAEIAHTTPAPDRDRRATTLRRAQESFDALQESAAPARPTKRRTIWLRLSDGVTTMIDRISPRGAMVATTALVAAGAFIVLPQDLFLLPGAYVEEEVVPVAPIPVDQEMDLADLSRENGRAGAGAVTSEATAPLGQRAHPAEAAQSLAQPAPVATARDESVADAKVSEGFTTTAPSVAPPLAQRHALALPDDAVAPIEGSTEAFANAEANPLKSVQTDPVSTFSIDVDTASYSVLRSSLTGGQMPPEAAVRIEEMVNYFPYAYPAPEGDLPFEATVSVFETPWNADTQLMHIGIQGARPALEDRPPLNLVFLIDTSGSMQDSNKLPLLKQSFRMMLAELRPEDQVAIVTYAGSAGRVLAPTAAGDRTAIEAALGQLEAGGSTAGQSGLEQAYETAAGMAEEGEVTRVILATDGDFNVGLADPAALEDFIAERRDTGVYLSVLGFGRGNLDDATMQALAQNGNGQAAYIDTLSEARKVLVDQLTGTLFPIANDVKIQVEFNPATIAEYRLIGYETRALRREDFNNDAVDAGEVGAGHQVTAIYEITPVGSPAVMNDDLRYGQATAAAANTDELAFLRLRYKAPGATESRLIETPVPTELGAPGDDVRFSAAIAGFGQLLRGSEFLGGWGYGDAIALATGARGEDRFGYRAEAISLMRLAEALDR